MVQKQLDDVIIAIAGGKVQGCPAFVICSTRVSSILQELLHCVQVIAIGSFTQPFQSVGLLARRPQPAVEAGGPAQAAGRDLARGLLPLP